MWNVLEYIKENDKEKLVCDCRKKRYGRKGSKLKMNTV